MEQFLINLNGKITDGQSAVISVFDRGLLYGDSVYETTRTFNRRPFRLQKHLTRLFDSADKIFLTPTLSKLEIETEILKTIEASPHQNQFLRIVLTRGTNLDLGLDPDLCVANNLIIYSKEISPPPDCWYTQGVDVVFYQKTSQMAGALPKTGNYQENIKAFKEAKRAQSLDALMINPQGFVTEGTTSNIWIVKGDKIITPPLEDGLLNGLTRQALFEMQFKNALPGPLSITEASLTPQDFFVADECFMTSTTRNLVPVTTIGKRPIGSGKPGNATLKLLKSYLQYVENQ